MKVVKKQKVNFLIVILTIMLSGTVFAQPPGGGQQGGQQGPPKLPTEKQIVTMVSDLADEISLSKEQEASVLKLYQTHFAEVEEKTSGNNRPERSEMEALKSSFEKEVKAVLTDEQQKEYEAFLKTQNSQRQTR